MLVFMSLFYFARCWMWDAELQIYNLAMTSCPCRWFFQQLISAVDYLHKMVGSFGRHIGDGAGRAGCHPFARFGSVICSRLHKLLQGQ